MRDDTPGIHSPAALLAEPTRAAIVMALMDGRSRCAKVLAMDAGVTPQTASAHLRQLVEGRLLACHREGRNRYYRIADAEIAQAVEVLARIAPRQPLSAAARPLRFARSCYDHLAGQLGVAITEAAERRGLLSFDDGGLRLGGRAHAFLAELGIDLQSLLAQRRPLVRTCIDWTERRPHIAGALGAALLGTFRRERWLEAVDGSRKLIVTMRGRAAFERLFDLGSGFYSH
jgi:DNA-binding transcriptional ArsR family regulator